MLLICLRNWNHLMHTYSSPALLKEPIIYSWSSVNILQNNFLCILQMKERQKGLKQHERVVFSALLHCGVIVFHWKQFQHSKRFKHFLRTFPSVLLRNIKLFLFIFLEKQGGQSFHTYSKQMEMKKSIYIIRNVLCM